MTAPGVGSRWRSAVCETEVIVVRPPADGVVLSCGGRPLLAQGEDREVGGAPDPAWAGGSEIGKRYTDPSTGLELLCTRTGGGTLAVDGRALELKAAKALPASD